MERDGRDNVAGRVEGRKVHRASGTWARYI